VADALTTVPPLRSAQFDGKAKNGFADLSRVARFFFVHDTETGKNVPNEHKIYQMVINYPKCL
jgi:hypothetical protein